MKRFFTLFIIVVMATLTFASPRTMEEAMQIAGRFAADNQPSVSSVQRIRRALSASRPAQPMQLAYTQTQTDTATPALYVFNTTSDDGGFVIVSADDRTRAILGYTDNGHFDSDNIPDNMHFWLRMYASEIASLSDDPATNLKAAAANFHATAANFSATDATTTYPTVAPLLGQTAWGQGTPFNNLCPEVNGDHCPTGCVATAAAQIMYHHKHPAKGTGSHSYQWNNQTLSADFANTTFDWANMLPSYKGNYSDTQATAVATLMATIGISCDMNYGHDASGAVTAAMLAALRTYFGYDAAIRALPKDCMDETEMLTLIGQDLQANHPILVNGRTTQDEGHAFVLDGMQSNGYVHINWGWDGYSDGYFAISSLDPYYQGTGGAASGQGFTEQVTAYIGIQPDRGGAPVSTLTADEVTITSPSRMRRGDRFDFRISTFTNISANNASGNVAILIYKDNALYTSVVTGLEYELLSGWYFDEYILNQYINDLKTGDYELSLGYQPKGTTSVYPILTKIARGERRFPVTVTADSVFIGKGTVNHDGIADVEFTQAMILDYTDGVGQTFLHLTLATSDYASTDGKQTAGSKWELGLVPGNRTSVVGTYRLSDTSEYGSMISNSYWTSLQYLVDDALVTAELSDGTVTVTLDSIGNYVFAFNIVANNKSYTNTVTIPADQITISKYNATDSKLYYSSLENTTVTALSASDALALIQSFASTRKTNIPYLVQGTISQMVNTPSQIRQHGTARFYISDDGTTDNQLYSFNTRWLNNEAFSTGTEIELGDRVVICAPLQNYNGTTPELLSGYIYQHKEAPHLHDITIRTRMASDTVFDTSRGLYYWWWEQGQAGQIIQAQLSKDGWWTATVSTMADSVSYLAVNQDVSAVGWDGCQQTYNSPFFASDACFYLDSVADGYRKGKLLPTFCDAFTAVWLPYDLQTFVKATGVEFSWKTAQQAPHYEFVLEDAQTGEISTYYREVPRVGLIFNGVYSFNWRVRSLDENGMPVSDFVEGTPVTTRENPYQPANMQASTADSITYYFTWDSQLPADHYLVSIYSHGYTYMAREIYEPVFVHTFELADTYTWRVDAYDADDYRIGYDFGAAFDVPRVPSYKVTDLHVTTNGNNLSAAWESNAVVFHVRIYESSTRDVVYSSFFPDCQVQITNILDGQYDLSVRPVNEDETFYIDEATEVPFTISSQANTNTYTVDIAAGDGGTVNTEVNGTYNHGDIVVIKATPAAGYRFTRWSDGSTQFMRTLVVSGDIRLTAAFETVKQHQVVIAPVEGGYTNPVADTYMVEDGTEFTIFAVPEENYDFTGWTINGETVTQNLYSFTVTQPVQITPQFTAKAAPLEYYTLTVSAGDGGDVRVSPLLDRYPKGSEVVLEALPDRGYTFNFWSDGNTHPLRTVLMTDNLLLTAFFSRSTSLPVTPVDGLTISVADRTATITTSTPQPLCIYDLMGNLLLATPATTHTTFTAPVAGVYLIRSANHTTKILINS